MKRLADNVKCIGIIVGIILLLILAFWWDFHIWRLEHPTAPGWVYIFHGKG